MSTGDSSVPAEWSVCHDTEHGFALRHPPDWRNTGPPGSCVGLQRGEPSLPGGARDVDVSIRVVALDADFPTDYLRPEVEPADRDMEVGRGVAYSDRSELVVNGLPGVRARFVSAGPTPNWGLEYAIRKEERVLDAYISRPSSAVEADFDRVIATLDW